MINKSICPICKTATKPQERYPNYVCYECTLKATDKSGKPLSFGNIDMGGGYEAIYTNTKEKYDSHICYINGVECIADEAKFGGIIVEVKNS